MTCQLTKSMIQVHYSNNPLDGNMASLQKHVTQQKAGRVPQTKYVPVISHVVKCETTLGLKRQYVVLEKNFKFRT